VDARQRRRLNLICEREMALALRAFDGARAAIFADHSARGLLQSGATIRAYAGPGPPANSGILRPKMD